MSEELTKWFYEYDKDGNNIRRCRRETQPNGTVKKVCIEAQG